MTLIRKWDKNNGIVEINGKRYSVFCGSVTVEIEPRVMRDGYSRQLSATSKLGNAIRAFVRNA